MRSRDREWCPYQNKSRWLSSICRELHWIMSILIFPSLFSEPSACWLSFGMNIFYVETHISAISVCDVFPFQRSWGFLFSLLLLLLLFKNYGTFYKFATSLCRVHVHLLCIVSLLVYGTLKQALGFALFRWGSNHLIA